MARQTKYHLGIEIDSLTNIMGYIKEPSGVDFIVDPTPLTAADRKKINEIIAYYKATGRKIPRAKTTSRHRLKSSRKKVVA